MKAKALWLLPALLSFALVGCVTQSTGAYDGAMTVTVENDTFTGSDNNYTNGLGVSWVSNEVKTYDEERFVRKWADFWSFLPFVGDDGYKTYASWSIAQEMHTPTKSTNPNPPKDDQPYAGVLYLDNVLYARRERTSHAWALKMGVVGPASQAEDVQKWFHEMIGSDEPMGWDKQLPDEGTSTWPTRLLTCGTRGCRQSAEWRLVPVGTAGLGNYFTGAAAGMYGEVGWNLVDALGVPALRAGLNAVSTAGVGPVNGWSVAFSAASAVTALRIICRSTGPCSTTAARSTRSHSSAWRTFGVCVRHRGFVFSLARTYFTDMFETERKNAEFGTFSVSWYF